MLHGRPEFSLDDVGERIGILHHIARDPGACEAATFEDHGAGTALRAGKQPAGCRQGLLAEHLVNGAEAVLVEEGTTPIGAKPHDVTRPSCVVPHRCDRLAEAPAPGGIPMAPEAAAGVIVDIDGPSVAAVVGTIRPEAAEPGHEARADDGRRQAGRGRHGLLPGRAPRLGGKGCRSVNPARGHASFASGSAMAGLRSAMGWRENRG